MLTDAAVIARPAEYTLDELHIITTVAAARSATDCIHVVADSMIKSSRGATGHSG